MGYRESVFEAAKKLPVTKGSFLITGATGLIGSCVVDVLSAANEQGSNFKVYALGRSGEKIEKRFGNKVIPMIQDIAEPLEDSSSYDYIIHCASNADPKSYAVQPVETILTNILGSRNVLEYCRNHAGTRMLFTSSFEVYGKIEGVAVYKEQMSGVIDQTLLRNGYPESKRSSELLVRSYVEEYDADAVIVRLPSVYGPTMAKSDSKAHAQFIRNALEKRNIVLKSKGEQIRTYCYVLDAVSAIFTVLFKGNTGEIYNISNEKSVASIAEVAEACAEIAGTKVVFDIPEETEKKGFSKPQNCILDNAKLKELGWEGRYNLRDGLRETMQYLRKNG